MLVKVMKNELPLDMISDMRELLKMPVIFEPTLTAITGII